MNIEAIRQYCIAKKAVTESFPFDENTLVFKVMNKMFALIALERVPPQINLKCNPNKALQLREEYDGIIIPGYHMNKKHWNSIYFQQLSPSLVLEQIDHSYDLVVSQLPIKLKTKIYDNKA